MQVDRRPSSNRALRWSSLLTLLAGCALPHAQLRGGDAGADARADGALADSGDEDRGAIETDAADVMELDGGDGAVVTMDASDVTDASMQPDASDASDASDGTTAMDATDASDAGSARDVIDVVDAREASADVSLVDAGREAGPEASVDVFVAPDASAMMDAAVDAAPLRYRLGAVTTLAWSPDAPGMAVSTLMGRCAAGHIVVGANTNVSSATNVLNGYTLLCAPLNANGTLGATVNGPTVASGGSDQMPRCNAGSVAVLRSVRAGAVIDDVLSDCVVLSALLPPMGREMIANTIRFTNENGGTERTLRCPLGSVLVGLDGTQEFYSLANRVGRVRPACAPIEAY